MRNRAAAVLLLAAASFAVNIWGYDLWNPNEPFFGEGAREMVVDGHWWVSHVNGQLNTHKPPLFFWLIALLSLAAGGVTSTTARLPSVASGVGSLALVLAMGRRRGSRKTALLAAVVLATSYLFWEKSRTAEIDALLCFLIWTALAAFVAWRAGDARGRPAGMLFWFAAALAVLAKGPVGLLVPLGIVALTLGTDRALGRWRDFAPISGPLVFALTAGAWVAGTAVWGPPEYSVWGALQKHFLERGLHGMHHVQPWWYFALNLPVQFLPWSFLAPGAIVLAWRRRDPFDRFLLAVVGFVVLFFSISTEKRAVYVLPAFPALALLTARFVGALLGWDAGPRVARRFLTVGQALLAGVLLAAGGALPLAAGRAGVDLPGWIFVALSIVLLAGGAATLVALVLRRTLAAVLAPAAAVTGAYLVAALVLFPASDAFKSGRELARQIEVRSAASRAAGNPVLAVGVGTLIFSFNFYSDGVYLEETDDLDDLERHLDRPDRVFAVIRGDLLDDAPQALRDRAVVLDEMHGGRRDAVLISNRPDDAPGSP